MLSAGKVGQEVLDCERALASARAKFEASKTASKEALSRLDAVDKGFRRQSILLAKIGEEASALQEELCIRSNAVSGKSSPERLHFSSIDAHVREADASVSEIVECRDKEQLQAAQVEIAELMAVVSKQEHAVEVARNEVVRSKDEEVARKEAVRSESEEVFRLRAELQESREHLQAADVEFAELKAVVSKQEHVVEIAQHEVVCSKDEEVVRKEAVRSESEEVLRLRAELQEIREAQIQTVTSTRRDIELHMAEKLKLLREECDERVLEVEEQHKTEYLANQALEIQAGLLREELADIAQQRSLDEMCWKEETQMACAGAKTAAEEEIENVRLQCKREEQKARSETKSSFIEELAKLESRCDELQKENAEAEASMRRRAQQTSSGTREGIDQKSNSGIDKRESGFAAGPNEVNSMPINSDRSSARGPSGTLSVPVVRGPLSPKGARPSVASRKSAMPSSSKKSLGRSSMKSLGVRFQDSDSDAGEGDGDEYGNRYSVAQSEIWCDDAAYSWSRAGSILHKSSDSEEDYDVGEGATETLATRRATSVPPDLSRHDDSGDRESFQQESRRSKTRDSSTVQALDLPQPPRKSLSTPQLARSSSMARSASAGRSFTGLHMRDRLSTTRGTVSKTATSEECGQCLSDGILKALRLEILYGCSDGGSPASEAFKDVRTLDLVTEAGREIEFEFEVVAPDVFRDLRRNAFGVDDDSFADSLGLHPLSGGRQGEGKSGSLFFFSWDKRYLVKTTDAVEVPFFFDGLDLYYEFMRGKDASFLPGGQTSSFLPRYSGFYGLKILNDVKSYLVVFENIFPPGVSLKEKYDLKGVLGSKRFVSDEQQAQGIEVLKDRNFLNRSFNVGDRMKQRLTAQLKKDVDFLEERGRIDYSLLLGVASINDLQVKPHTDLALQWPTIDCHGLQSVRRGEVLGDEVFFLGIIDVLQEYTKKKVAENKLRSLKHGLTHMLKSSAHADSSNAVSAVPPPQYAKRFYDFLVSRME